MSGSLHGWEVHPHSLHIFLCHSPPSNIITLNVPTKVEILPSADDDPTVKQYTVAICRLQ